MELPSNLQRLPPEALIMLRYLGTHGAASAAEIEAGTGLSSRLVGRAIRRLVNYDLIELKNSIYALTGDGTLSARQLADYDRATEAESMPQAPQALTFHRRLAIVMPRALASSTPTELFIGVNPPNPDSPDLPGPVHLELRLDAVNGDLSTLNIGLDVPPSRAATPSRVMLTPKQVGQKVRVRLDVFQALDDVHHEMVSLGGIYFDVPVAGNSSGHDATMRAVGMDLYLKPAR